MKIQKKFDPDQVLVEGNRFVFQRAFQRNVGREGERILRVVVDKSGKIITYFPVHTFERVAGAGAKRVAGAGAVALGIFEEGVAEAHAKGESERASGEAKRKRYEEEAESGIISFLFVDSYAGYEPPPPSKDFAKEKSDEIIQKLTKAGVTVDEATRSEIFETVYSAYLGRSLPADVELEFPEEFVNEIRLEQERIRLEEKRLEEYRKLHPAPERLWRGTFQ